ncbi:hypothetical protein F2Q68_00044695 [Brassica cretica]|uniref:Uncharacterized protein n=1 Tax=Brassica cretica TaxID=69181 RepID=A0A8S9LRR0_BRACR|nr:hypothetical protein F2Q68_00044695 [Brassica cretica]
MEAMWAIGVMREWLCGRLELMEARWAIGVIRERLCGRFEKFTDKAHPWIADDLNKGRLYNFYWLVAVIVTLNFLIFLVFSKWYVYKDKRLAELGIELEDEPDIPMGHA